MHDCGEHWCTLTTDCGLRTINKQSLCSTGCAVCGKAMSQDCHSETARKEQRAKSATWIAPSCQTPNVLPAAPTATAALAAVATNGIMSSSSTSAFIASSFLPAARFMNAAWRKLKATVPHSSATTRNTRPTPMMPTWPPWRLKVFSRRS